jgi:hypothetical protein
MTYTAPNHNNCNLTRETTQWICGDYTITKVAAWAVDGGVHVILGLPTHCDVYKTSTGDWCVTLDEAIAACQEADTINDDITNDDITGGSDRSDILNNAIVEELGLNISQVNPDGDDTPVYEIRRNGARVEYIREPVDGFYELPQLAFAYTTFHSIESAAIALMEFLRPAEVPLAEAVAIHVVADRQLMPDY